MLLTQRTVVGRHPLAIARVGAGLHLVDKVAHGQRMVLGGAEHQGLFMLVDLLHENFDPMGFAFLNLDNLIEVY